MMYYMTPNLLGKLEFVAFFGTLVRFCRGLVKFQSKGVVVAIACAATSLLITWLQTVYVSFAAPSSQPRNVQLTPKSSTQLEITWEAPTLVDWNSEHLSYKVGYKYGRLGDIRK